MKLALITGINGQDGSYLAELLLAEGYCVVGAVRDPASAQACLPEALAGHVELVAWDMSSQQAMTAVLAQFRPCEVYNLAAYSSGAGMYDDPVAIADVNGLAVARLLEAIRSVDVRMRFCQASSREVFGAATTSPQTESTPRKPRSPYGAAKLFADSMVRIYREHYGMFAASAILFNHESPRRSLSFVTRKITHSAASIKLGLATQLSLGNLDARRDWGFAGDYVRGMWLMQQQAVADDYVFCTGEIHSVREFCEQAFRYVGLDYRDFLVQDQTVHRPAEPCPLVGSAVKAKGDLGWVPQVDLGNLVRMMVDADLQALSNLSTNR